MKSFIKANYQPKEEPQNFKELAEESKVSLDQDNLKHLVSQFEQRVKVKPQLLDDIWIKSGDGGKGIDREQLFQICNMIGEPITQEELNEILREADLDGDGNIDADEFKSIISSFI